MTVELLSKRRREQAGQTKRCPYHSYWSRLHERCGTAKVSGLMEICQLAEERREMISETSSMGWLGNISKPGFLCMHHFHVVGFQESEFKTMVQTLGTAGWSRAGMSKVNIGYSWLWLRRMLASTSKHTRSSLRNCYFIRMFIPLALFCQSPRCQRLVDVREITAYGTFALASLPSCAGCQFCIWPTASGIKHGSIKMSSDLLAYGVYSLETTICSKHKSKL